MLIIKNAQVCLQNDHSGEMFLRDLWDIDVPFANDTNQMLSIGTRAINWKEIGKVSPVVTVVFTEDDETGELRTFSQDYASDYIFEHK